MTGGPEPRPGRDDRRRSIVVGTAGHIDHGKSALVRALTGINPDRLKEEQIRGITIDLGFAHAEIDGVGVAFVDVPGHERFVRNMLAGAGGIDAVILVVAADESVMPQTREHFDICRLLGIRRGIIALTKSDLADAETRDLATLEAAELVEGTPLEHAPIVPVSSVTGEGLDALRAAIAALADGALAPAREGVTRLPVDRVFTMKGFGAVVTGTLLTGALAVGDEVVALPEGRTVRVRGLQVHGHRVEHVRAPGRAAVNLGAVDAADLRRGMTLATEASLSVTRRVDLSIDLLPEARALRHGARVRLHHGTSELLGRVSIAALREPGQTDWRRVEAGEAEVAVPPGGQAFVRLRLEQSAVLTRGDLVVLRAYSPPRTIAGGRVLDPEPPRAGVRRGDVVERLTRLSGDDVPVALWVSEAGGRGLPADAPVDRGGLGPDDAAKLVAACVSAGHGVRAADRIFAAERAAAIRAQILPVLAEFHHAAPLEAGMPREALRERVAGDSAPELFAAVLTELTEGGAVVGTDRLAVPGHQATLAGQDAAISERVEQAVGTAGLAALDASALVDQTGARGEDVERVVKYLIRHGRLVRIDSLLVAPAALEALRADVERDAAAAAPARASIDIAAFKARYGLSRRHAIPLLEWLDRERLTRRVGNRREIVAG